jgi:glycosyltransferase involved in cell wall biosynthesis
VIDNNSTDGSKMKIESMFDSKLVSVVQNVKNLGSTARNIGILNKSADYNFVFDDDISPTNPNIIFETVILLENNKYFGALCFRCINYYSNQTEYSNFSEIASRKTIDNLYECMSVTGNGMCFRTTAMNGFTGYEDWMFWGGEEFPFAMKMLFNKIPIAYSEQIGIFHRRADRIITSEKSIEIEVRNNLWTAFKFFPLPIAIYFSLHHFFRRFLLNLVRGNKENVIASCIGIKKGLLGLNKIFSNRNTLTVSALARHNRWFINLFFRVRNTKKNFLEFGHP